jgi:hypothetical protein
MEPSGIERGGLPSLTEVGGCAALLIRQCFNPPLNNGGAKRDRTADLLRARQALSQLSYSPSVNWCYY